MANEMIPTGMSDRDAAQLRAKQAKANPIKVVRDGADATITTPKWDRFQASKEAEVGGVYGTALAQHEASTAWAQYARETFAKLYDSGLAKEIPHEDRPMGSDWVGKLHEQAEALPEWRALKDRARRDAWACGVAAGEALNVIGSQVKPPDQDPQKIQDQIETIKELSEGKQLSKKQLARLAALQRALQDAQANHAQATQLLDAKGAGLRSAMRAAATKAQETITEMDDAMSTLGAGDQTGAVSRVAAPPQELRTALQKNQKLRKILKIAGRMKASAIQKQRSKATHGREELCDVVSGSDLSRLVPSELANLATPTTEALLYRKLMENAAQVYELRGKVSIAEGPIILAVDESGSMAGQRDMWAKGVAFAMMEIAARQKRPFAYVHFDSRVTRTDEISQPRSVDLKQLEEFCNYFTGGGTSIRNALDHCATMLEGAAQARADKPWKRADVILVTDGDDHDFAGQKAAVERIRKLSGHLYGIFIDSYDYGAATKNDGNAKHVSAMCDQKLYFSTADIDKADPTKLGDIFSI